MSHLTEKQYTFTLYVQHVFILFDACVNAFGTFGRTDPVNLLIVYALQDLCLILSIAILLAIIFSTYIFQAGLLHVLYKKFRLPTTICLLYVTLSISLHSWHIRTHYHEPLTYFWPVTYHCLYSFQRTVAVLYYYSSKRAYLQLSDPRLHEATYWLQKQFPYK